LTLQDDDVYVVLASDGVWEFIPTEIVVEIVAENSTPATAARGIVDEAAAAWEQESEDEARDDITCTVIFLKNLSSLSSSSGSFSSSFSSSSSSSSSLTT